AALSRQCDLGKNMVNGTPLSLTVTIERWPIAGRFTISRGAKTEAAVVVVALSNGTARGRGECVPYARYGESVESVVAAVEKMREHLLVPRNGWISDLRLEINDLMPRGAARNALDCALWDFEAK